MSRQIMELNDMAERGDPSEEELNEYAEFLGIDPEKEPYLMWIAREGVVAPVPEPWKAMTEVTDDGEPQDIFYWNKDTSESIWDHPLDDHYRDMVEEARQKHAGMSASQADAAAGGGSAKISTISALAENEDDADKPLPPRSEEKVAAKSLLSPPARATATATSPQMSSPGAGSERGSAGVGLAAAIMRRDADEEDDSSVDEDVDRQANASGTTASEALSSPSQSGSRSAPLAAVTRAAELQLENSGHSGLSGSVSFAVSDDDVPSDLASGPAANSRFLDDDSLEFSASCLPEELMGELAFLPPFRAPAAAASDSVASAHSTAENALPAPLSAYEARRLRAAQKELESLARALSVLKGVRETQRQYLRIIKTGLCP